jgi:hypothetical protein
MKTLKTIKKISLQAEASVGGCVDRCTQVAHIWFEGQDLGPGLHCVFCYAV